MEPSGLTMQLCRVVGCLITSILVANSAAAVEARFSTRLVPAMQDRERCAPLNRPFWARCDPRGFVRLRGRGLVVAAANLEGCEAFRVSVGDLITPAAWLVVYVNVLPPSPSNCSCPSVGCCQTPPITTTLVAPVSSKNGEVQFKGRLPFTKNTQVEIRGVEIRAAGSCLETAARDLQSGEQVFAELGPALAVGGTGRLF